MKNIPETPYKHTSTIYTEPKTLNQNNSTIEPENTTKHNHSFQTYYMPRVDPVVACPEHENITDQSGKDDADINTILKRFETTGELPSMIKSEPQYGDFSDMGSFHEAQEIVARAKEQFDALPARVRDRFANDPARFLEFCENADNLEEMGKLGLLVTKEKEKPDPVLETLKEIKANTTRPTEDTPPKRSNS